MPKIMLLPGVMRPSRLLRRMREHSGDVSVGSKSKVMAQRIILKRKVTFYENGLRVVEGDLTEEEQFHSEVLKLAHASLLINAPVGDKRMCYVDAKNYVVEVWLYGTRADTFIKNAMIAIKSGQVRKDLILDSPIQELKNERNVRLFGR